MCVCAWACISIVGMAFEASREVRNVFCAFNYLHNFHPTEFLTLWLFEFLTSNFEFKLECVLQVCVYSILLVRFLEKRRKTFYRMQISN